MKQVGACRAATLLRSPLPVPYAEKQQPTQTSLSSNNPPHPSPSPPPPALTCLPIMTASCSMMAAWLDAMLAWPWSIRLTRVLSLARAWARALERSTCRGQQQQKGLVSRWGQPGLPLATNKENTQMLGPVASLPSQGQGEGGLTDACRDCVWLCSDVWAVCTTVICCSTVARDCCSLRRPAGVVTGAM